MEKIFIQIIGGHAVGKSTLAYWFKEEFKDNAILLGTYKESKTTLGLYTGGMDALKLTNEQRFEIIKEKWKEETPIIVAEGMIISYFKSFVSKYGILQRECPRNIIIIHLFSSLEKVKERVYKRSEEKEMNEKRLANLISKLNTAKSVYNKAKYMSSYNCLEFDTTNDESFDKIKEVIKKEINGEKNADI